MDYNTQIIAIICRFEKKLMCTPWILTDLWENFTLKLNFIHKSADYGYNPWIISTIRRLWVVQCIVGRINVNNPWIICIIFIICSRIIRIVLVWDLAFPSSKVFSFSKRKTKNEVSMSTGSKVIARTDRHTHTQDENITSTACAGGNNFHQYQLQLLITWVWILTFYSRIVIGQSHITKNIYWEVE